MGETTNPQRPAHDQQQPETQLLRACANALWPYLQRRVWRPHKVKRQISPTGAPRGNRYNTGAIPGPEPTIEVLSSEPYLHVIATSQDTRLDVGLGAHLTREAAHIALSRVPAAHVVEYDEALDDRRIEVPFHYDTRDGYVRNPKLTRGAALALLAVLQAAEIERLTPEQDAAVIDARNEGDTISLNAVLAAMERAGA